MRIEERVRWWWAGRPLGAATARRLLASGAEVTVADLNAEKARRLPRSSARGSWRAT